MTSHPPTFPTGVVTSSPLRRTLITCVGEPLIVLTADPGPLEAAEHFARGPGGAELNVATTLTGLGIPAAMIARVGDDGFGRYLLNHLRTIGVDTSAIAIDPHRSTGAYVKQRGAGTGLPHDLGRTESQMLYYRKDSAASTLSIDALNHPTVQNILARTSVLHVTGITVALSDSARRAVRHLLHGEYRCSFDVNYRAALWDSPSAAADALADCVRSSDIVFVGLDEAESAFDLRTPEAIRSAFPQPDYLVVKDDAHHVTAFHRDQSVVVPALNVPVVEKIGAGDAFASGFLTGVLTGKPIDVAVRLGHVCAATTLGSTRDAVVPSDDVVQRHLLMDEHHWRTTHFASSAHHERIDT